MEDHLFAKLVKHGTLPEAHLRKLRSSFRPRSDFPERAAAQSQGASAGSQHAAHAFIIELEIPNSASSRAFRQSLRVAPPGVAHTRGCSSLRGCLAFFPAVQVESKTALADAFNSREGGTIRLEALVELKMSRFELFQILLLNSDMESPVEKQFPVEQFLVLRVARGSSNFPLSYLRSLGGAPWWLSSRDPKPLCLLGPNPLLGARSHPLY